MNKVKRILLPLAFSENDLMAAEYANEIASGLGAEVDLVHVASLDFLMGHPVPLKYDHKAYKDYEEEIAEKMMTAFVDKALPDVNIRHRAVVTGNTADEILRYARENDIDMIVMAAHCRKRLEISFMGSVTDRVVRKSQSPVLVVHPPCPA